MTQSDILDEVLSDAAHEKRVVLLRKALPWIIVMSFLCAVLIGAYGWYNAKRLDNLRSRGDSLVDLSLKENQDKSLIVTSLRELMNSAGVKQSEIIALLLAGKLSAAGEVQEALELLKNVAQNLEYQNITRSYAKIMWLAVVMDNKDLSESDQKRAREYIESFSSLDNPFYYFSLLMKALFFQKIGQDALASESANAIISSNVVDPELKIQAQALVNKLKYYK